jgi:hypothetical protein
MTLVSFILVLFVVWILVDVLFLAAYSRLPKAPSPPAKPSQEKSA